MKILQIIKKYYRNIKKTVLIPVMSVANFHIKSIWESSPRYFVKTKKIAKNLKRILEVGYCKCHHLSAILKYCQAKDIINTTIHTSDNSQFLENTLKKLPTRLLKNFLLIKKSRSSRLAVTMAHSSKQ